ncbi:ABC transporter permease [Butyrivibrio sp. VCD2006]|uniref:ABC transporter permease n=1 Tax=Butyrivibrio sp. VCD2006 TaxID=1280664 RepID=UPI00040F9098|nr:ABC transporter permease [Butyrivibrio sp. VCD2006]
MTKKREMIFSIVRAALAILISLVVAMLLIFISADGSSVGEKFKMTGEALKQLLIGPLFRVNANGVSFEGKRLADILSAMIPTIFTGLSVCVMFSANQFNLGSEGGIMLGAFVSAVVAIYYPMPAGLHAVMAVVIGGAVVALVMLVPAILKVKLDVSEMVCSLMLNYVIMYIIKYLMNNYYADKTKGQIQTYPFLNSSRIASIVNNPVINSAKLTWGFVIALIAVIITGLFMYRSRWGYQIRMIGINKDFSKYSGMKVGFIIVISQVIGGFLAGAGGGIEVLGRYNTFSWSSLPGYGWTGITIAILAGNNPYYVPLAAFFMAYLQKGCDMMATYANVPMQLISIVQAVIFLFFAAEQFLSKYKQSLVVKTAQEEIAAKAALSKEGGAANG